MPKQFKTRKPTLLCGFSFVLKMIMIPINLT
ncbi:hypothetical protein VPHF99_0068 [Vibrio phage F99]